jgi:glycosyltransferase involved in cell wall biosynthesis
MDGGSRPQPWRVVVVGSGTHFLSGISVYTVRVANALAARNRVALITMRRLVPARLYPGWKRVGADLSTLRVDSRVARFDGVDWFWVPSIFLAAWFLLRHRPQVMVMQWWSGSVLHSYLLLAALARLWGSRVVIEFHEVLDTGEANIPLVHRYVRTLAPFLMRMADGLCFHSEFDRQLVGQSWPMVTGRPSEVLPHGPYDHYLGEADKVRPLREAPPEACNLLFFGVIRPFKGVEHLVAAFEQIPDDEIGNFWLTVVGETWEGWTLPAEMIARSPRRDRITFVNRYVSDEELHGYLAGADAVVLPYLRSSLSGPLHVAMSYGLPIVLSEVGGNVESAAGYRGIIPIVPGEPAGIAEALRGLPALRGARYEHPQSWSATAAAYERLFERLRRQPAATLDEPVA